MGVAIFQLPICRELKKYRRLSNIIDLADCELENIILFSQSQSGVWTTINDNMCKKMVVFTLHQLKSLTQMRNIDVSK